MASEFQLLQPETTFSGAGIAPLQTGLPKTTKSLCPECNLILDARIFESGGRVLMERAPVPTVGVLTKFEDSEGNVVAAMKYDEEPHT